MYETWIREPSATVWIFGIQARTKPFETERSTPWSRMDNEEAKSKTSWFVERQKEETGTDENPKQSSLNFVLFS